MEPTLSKRRSNAQDRIPPRTVEPEWLDELPAEDPSARRSRRDLRRINWVMGNGRILAGRIGAVRSLAELGGGDGTLLLDVLRRLGPVQPAGSAIVVDRVNLSGGAAAARFAELGWRFHRVAADVFTWLKQADKVELMVANLFLHHFKDERLAELLGLIEKKTERFVACEPRRLRYPRLAGELVALLGCNRVTRHDAVASIRAGFVGQELSRLWPAGSYWEITEGPAGLFSHAFAARRRSPAS
jgi:hypothetical protein